MLKRKISAIVAMALLGSTSMVNAQAGDTMSKLIDALHDSGSISSEAYSALKASAEAESNGKKPVNEEVKNAITEEVLKVSKIVEENAKKHGPTDAKVIYKDGFKLESADGQQSLGINGRLQLDSRNFLNDTAADVFDLRRAYLIFSGKVFDKFEYSMIGVFNGKNAAQPLFWDVNAHLWDEFQIKMGQLRFPFGQNERTSSRNLDFMERAIPMQFVPGIDRGVMVHGYPKPGIYYAAAVVNGGVRQNPGLASNNQDEFTDADGKDILGRLAFDAAKMLGHKDNIYHVGVAYGTGIQPGKNSFQQASTEARGLQFFKTKDFNNLEFKLQRFGFDSTLAFGPVKFTGEYVKNVYSGESLRGDGFERNLDTYYLSANWMITGENYSHFFGKDGGFGNIKPNRNFDMSGGWGAWELAARFSHLDASDFKTSNLTGTGVLSQGSANQANAYTIGLKWYLNPSVRFYMEYVNTDFNMPVGIKGQVDDPDPKLGKKTIGTATSEQALNFSTRFDF